ncbi:homocysteine S-methyltransferase family protein [Shigella flexneri]
MSCRILISGTITDASRARALRADHRTFPNSLRHAEALTFGLNCALGPDQLRQFIQELSPVSDASSPRTRTPGYPTPLVSTIFNAEHR